MPSITRGSSLTTTAGGGEGGCGGEVGGDAMGCIPLLGGVVFFFFLKSPKNAMVDCVKEEEGVWW